jgi:GDP-L-fucose synthase
MMIHGTVVQASHLYDVKKLLYLGSSCIYPRHATQPITEDQLLTGPLEPTNEWYAIAKIAGIKLCESFNRQFGRDYRSVMPTNLYGPGDNFHTEYAHVIPALLRRFHEATETNAKSVSIWGSGKPRREFLHVDDMAAASVHVMELYPEDYWSAASPMMSHINVGSGRDCTISELAHLVAEVTGFGGSIEFDRSKPDGTPRKLLDVSRLQALGWSTGISLSEGLKDAYAWFLDHQVDFRGR